MISPCCEYPMEVNEARDVIHNQIRRRRTCKNCGQKWVTYERLIQDDTQSGRETLEKILLLARSALEEVRGPKHKWAPLTKSERDRSHGKESS